MLDRAGITKDLRQSKLSSFKSSVLLSSKNFYQLTKKDLPFLAVTAVSSMLIVWLLRRIPWPWDPMYVFEHATYMSGAEPRWESFSVEHRHIRLGLSGPVAIAQRLFGFSEGAYYLVPLISIAIFSTGTYALARLVLNRWQSLVAPLLAIFSPVILPWASQVFPDIPAAGFFTWGIFFLVLPYRFEKIGFPWWLSPALAGFCFGYAAITREAIIICAPLILVVIAFLRPKVRSLFVLLGSAITVFIVYLIALKLLSGSWTTFFSSHFNRVTFQESDLPAIQSEAWISKTAAGEVVQGTIWRALAEPFNMLYSHWKITAVSGLLLLLSPLAGIYSLIKRHSFIWLIGATIFTLWLCFALAGQLRGGSGGFVFLLTKNRYWAPLYPGLAVGGAYFLFFITNRVREKVNLPISIFSLIFCILILIPGWQAYNNHVDRVSSENHLIEFRDWLNSHEETGIRLYGSKSEARLLRIYSKDFFGNPISDMEIIRKNPGSIPSNQFITDKTLLPISPYSGATPNNVFLSGDEPDLKTSLNSLPEDWTVQFVSSDTKLVLIGPSSKTGQQLISISSLDDDSLKKIPLEGDDEFIQIRWTLSTDSHKRPKIFCYLNNGERVFSVTARHTTSDFIDGYQTVDSFCPGSIDGLPTEISVSIRGNPTREETDRIEIISHKG